MPTLTKGDKAPVFTLIDQNEHTVSLENFKGKRLLVYFYPKADTPGCTRQSCSVSEALPKLTELTVFAVGISPDIPVKQKKFDEKYGLKFTLLSDPDFATARAYGAFGVKNVYGKQKEGIVRSSFLIDEDGRIIAAWYKVSPEDTVSNVLSEISGKH
jgi:thioredoxin-dependent peroxiredoxin